MATVAASTGRSRSYQVGCTAISGLLLWSVCLPHGARVHSARGLAARVVSEAVPERRRFAPLGSGTIGSASGQRHLLGHRGKDLALVLLVELWSPFFPDQLVRGSHN